MSDTKIVQISVSAVVYDGDLIERLYALDSNGQIWFWQDLDDTRTAGWVAHALPSEKISERR